MRNIGIRWGGLLAKGVIDWSKKLRSPTEVLDKEHFAPFSFETSDSHIFRRGDVRRTAAPQLSALFSVKNKKTTLKIIRA